MGGIKEGMVEGENRVEGKGGGEMERNIDEVSEK